MTPKEEEGGRLLYEKGYLINDIAEYYGVGRQTIRAIKDKRGWERKVGGVELKATEEDLKIMKEMVSAVPTLELAIPDVSKMGTLQLVQLQNLSRIDYMLSIGDIALKKLRSDAELLAGVGSSDEMVKLCASFEKVSRPIVRLMEERLLMVNSMPNLTQEESFEDNIRKVVDETDAAVRKERNEFQRSVMPDVVYDEKKAVSEGEEMRGRLERLGKNEEEMNLRRSSGLRNNSPEII
jgi:hypothetical protein